MMKVEGKKDKMKNRGVCFFLLLLFDGRIEKEKRKASGREWVEWGGGGGGGAAAVRKQKKKKNEEAKKRQASLFPLFFLFF